MVHHDFCLIVLGLVGLFLAGLIANACVSWYEISSREGASGYFVVFVALGGGIAGLVLGAITAIVMTLRFEARFWGTFGVSLGILLLIAALAALLCRGYADIAPTLDGRLLDLEVEFRFGDQTSGEAPPTSEGDWQFLFASLAGHTRRRYWEGEIQTSLARFEGGRWIVPTRVALNTERGPKSVTLAVREATEVMSFLLPLPARPGHRFEDWSDWLPRQQADGGPWPSDQMSVRFRIQKSTRID